MIGSLKGKVEFKEGMKLIIDVNGVGYKVSSSSDVLSKAKIGEELKIYIYTHVKEDVLELFGFYDTSSLNLFEKIISISGIGPRTALNIFSIGTSRSITEAIIEGNVDFFTGVPRLGRKNAQKLIIELRGKLGSLDELDLSAGGDEKFAEVLNALKSFGFSAAEAKEAINKIDKKVEKVEERIKFALKYLGK